MKVPRVNFCDVSSVIKVRTSQQRLVVWRTKATFEFIHSGVRLEIHLKIEVNDPKIPKLARARKRAQSRGS